jgi:hypothetical protein
MQPGDRWPHGKFTIVFAGPRDNTGDRCHVLFNVYGGADVHLGTVCAGLSGTARRAVGNGDHRAAAVLDAFYELALSKVRRRLDERGAVGLQPSRPFQVLMVGEQDLERMEELARASAPFDPLRVCPDSC